jgi:hypothetical protein
MAKYSGTVSSAHPKERVWSYLADLRSVAEWDPSIEAAHLRAGTPRAAGSSYEIEISFFGRRIALPYRTIEVEPGRRIVFAAETGAVAIRDEAVVTTAKSGSRATWSAELRPKGALRLLQPLLALAFRRVGSRAEAGLRRCLAQPTLEVRGGEGRS